MSVFIFALATSGLYIYVRYVYIYIYTFSVICTLLREHRAGKVPCLFLQLA